MGGTRIVVTELKLGVPCATRILISQKASDKLDAFLTEKDSEDRFAKTLKRIAAHGFWNFQGPGRTVRPEGGGVFAIGISKFLFRIAGFYSKADRTEFVAIDAYEKPGQRRGRDERGPEGNRVCREAARVKEETDWREYVITPKIVRPPD
jgi:hypothetical protein